MAWSRHAKAAAAQKATGRPARAYNQLEAKLAKLLDEAGVDYRWQFPLGPYVYDFLLPNRTLVEAHGTYWHADPRRYDRKALAGPAPQPVARPVNAERFCHTPCRAEMS
jgi:G:T-mismatch repair DNA endonuclease (very short patch repair protein)